MKYRKKPVVIEAVRWTGENRKEIEAFCGANRVTFVKLSLSTVRHAVCVSVHGVKLYAIPGDYIVKDTTGVCYPFVSDIFEEMYEEAEE